jgi:adenylate cyclase
VSQGPGDAFERTLLGAPPHLTESGVVQASGARLELTRMLWQALGFPDVGPDVVAFGEADVEALQISLRLVDSGLIDEGRLLLFSRLMGQALSRLAEEEVAVMGDVLASQPELAAMAVTDLAGAAEVASAVWVELLPDVERLQSYIWRRHLAAASIRLLSAYSRETQGAPVVIGFADLVGYTQATRELAIHEIASVVDRFESRIYRAVVGQGARVVKTLGDEVMFLAEEPLVAAAVALALVEEPDQDPVRVGLAFGRVLHRGGDVFGPVVNLASRCTSIARPGTVVVDRELAAELGDVPGVLVRAMPPQKVRGYERLQVSVLRRDRAP